MSYEAPLTDSFCVHTEPNLLDRIVIRGRYRTLSIIVVGAAAEEAEVENCSILWGNTLPQDGEEKKVFGSGGKNETTSRCCSHLNDFLPLKKFWQAKEHLADKKIHKVFPQLDIKSNDAKEFDKVKKEVLAVISQNLGFGDEDEQDESVSLQGKIEGVIDKVVDCLEKTEGAPYNSLRLSAMVSVLLCASPEYVTKFAKKGGIDGLWNIIQHPRTSVESKFWSMLSFLAASSNENGLECLAGHAHTIKGASALNDGLQNLEQGLLSLAMKPEFADLAHLSARVIQNLQLYNASVTLKSLALQLVDQRKSNKKVDSANVDSLLASILNIHDVYSQLEVTQKLTCIANSSIETKVNTFVDEKDITLPSAHAVAVQSLLHNRGVASLSTILALIGSFESSDEMVNLKIEHLIRSICEICECIEEFKYFDVLLIRDTSDVNLLCNALAVVGEYRLNSNLSNLEMKLRQSMLTFLSLDTLCMRVGHVHDHRATDVNLIMEAMYELLGNLSKLYETGGLCHSLQKYVLAWVLSAADEIEQASTYLQFGVAMLEILYVLISVSKGADNEKVVYLMLVDKFLPCKPDRERFGFSPYKIESLLEVKTVIKIVSKSDPMVELQKYMNEIEIQSSAVPSAPKALNPARMHGMMFAIKEVSSFMKTVPIGALERTSLSISGYMESIKQTLLYLAEQSVSLQLHQTESLKGLLLERSSWFLSSMNIIVTLDACLVGIEGCLQFLLANDVNLSLCEFFKAFVKSYDIIMYFSGIFEGTDCAGIIERLSKTYTKCLRMRCLSGAIPSIVQEILGAVDEGSISFSVAKYLHPAEVLRTLKLMNELIPFENVGSSIRLKEAVRQQSESCTAGLLSILSQAAFFSFPGIKRSLIELCMKVSHLGPNLARAIIPPLLELLQQEYEIVCEDEAEIRCTENLCDVIQVLSTDALCKSVLLDSGAISIMLSIFKQPLLRNTTVNESSLPSKVIQTIYNLCDTGICLDKSSPLYVRAVEDSPSIDEGTNFVSTVLDAIRALSEEVMGKVIDIFVLLSSHIPGKVALRSGASQWKTNAYWTGEGSQQGGTVDAASALASAARFLRSSSSSIDNENKKTCLTKGAEILESLYEGNDMDDEEEEPPQAADLESRYEMASQLKQQSFGALHGLDLQNFLERLSFSDEWLTEEQTLVRETEVQAQNRWHEDGIARTSSLASQIKSMSEILPTYGGKLTSETGENGMASKPFEDGANQSVGDTGKAEIGAPSLEFLEMETETKHRLSGNGEDDLYGDIAGPGSAPLDSKGAENVEGDDLYGDIDMGNAELDSGALASEADLDTLTPETIAKLLQNPEQLQPLLEKHPQLLSVLQQSLNS